MSLISFDNYTALARDDSATNTEVAGRFPTQILSEKRIMLDVVSKLDLSPEDSLLEIGCGPGNLLLPLSFLVSKSSGIDNKAAIERLNCRSRGLEGVSGIEGDFLAMELPKETFNKILIYSVFHYLDTEETIFKFIDRACSLLAPGGKLLIGDLPNIDKKNRFLNSDAGKAFLVEWKKNNSGNKKRKYIKPDNELVTINDSLLLKMISQARLTGLDAYVLPQPADLPFGSSREDLLFTKYR